MMKSKQVSSIITSPATSKRLIVLFTILALSFSLLFMGCSIDGSNDGVRGRIVVTNQHLQNSGRMARGAARNVIPSENIELYIPLLKYHGEVWRGEGGYAAIGIVAPYTEQNAPAGYTGPLRPYWTTENPNEGWFRIGSVDIAYANLGDFPVINLWVEKMRIGGEHGEVYPFPPLENGQAQFGKRKSGVGGVPGNGGSYPEAFAGFSYNGEEGVTITTTFKMDLTDETIAEYWEKNGDQWVIRSGKNPYDLITITGCLHPQGITVCNVCR